MNDRDAADRRGDTRPLPRASQYLAIPLGGLAPAHRERAGVLRLWHRHSATALTAAGCAAAAAAVLLSAAPRSIPAFSDGAALRIGDVTLHRQPVSPVQGFVAYGGDASVLVSGNGVTSRTAGSATIGSSATSGHCAPATRARSGGTIRCAFTVGNAFLTSEDVFDTQTHSWRRTYSDGVVVVFAVAGRGTPVPIPLPLGR